VQAAVPLSRFVLDAAAEDCDMDTAEGARTWPPTPGPCGSCCPTAPGAQLLGDIAAQVRIGVHELQQLWGLRGAAQPARARAMARPPPIAAPPAALRCPTARRRAPSRRAPPPAAARTGRCRSC
jgi:DNA primase